MIRIFQFLPLLLLLPAGTGLQAAGNSTQVFALKLDASTARQWCSSDPSAVSVGWQPPGDAAPNGALALVIRKKCDGEIRIAGPVLPLAAIPGAAKRELRLRLTARAEKFGTTKVKFGILGENGRWAQAWAIRRENTAVIDIVNNVRMNIKQHQNPSYLP